MNDGQQIPKGNTNSDMINQGQVPINNCPNNQQGQESQNECIQLSKMPTLDYADETIDHIRLSKMPTLDYVDENANHSEFIRLSKMPTLDYVDENANINMHGNPYPSSNHNIDVLSTMHVDNGYYFANWENYYPCQYPNDPRFSQPQNPYQPQNYANIPYNQQIFYNPHNQQPENNGSPNIGYSQPQNQNFIPNQNLSNIKMLSQYNDQRNNPNLQNNFPEKEVTNKRKPQKKYNPDAIKFEASNIKKLVKEKHQDKYYDVLKTQKGRRNQLCIDKHRRNIEKRRRIKMARNLKEQKMLTVQRSIFEDIVTDFVPNSGITLDISTQNSFRKTLFPNDFKKNITRVKLTKLRKRVNGKFIVGDSFKKEIILTNKPAKAKSAVTKTKDSACTKANKCQANSLKDKVTDVSLSNQIKQEYEWKEEQHDITLY